MESVSGRYFFMMKMGQLTKKPNPIRGEQYDEKTEISVLTVLLVLTAVLSGCTGAKETSSSEPKRRAGETPKAERKSPRQANPVALNLWTFNELHKTYYEKTMELWNEAHPDQPIELTVENYPNAEMHNKLLIALQSGVGAPDIVDINVNFFSNFLKGDIQLVAN